IVLVRLRFFALPAAAFALVVLWPSLRQYADRLGGRADHNPAVSLDTEYFCPMCPGVVSDWPARCSVCNIALVRRKRGDATPLPDGVVARMQLSPYRLQLAGVRTAPVAWMPLAREVTFAALVRPGERPWLEADVFDLDVPVLTEGRPAEVSADAFPGHTPCSGRGRRLQTEAAGAGRSLRVVVDIDDPKGELRPGLMATVRVAAPVRQLEPFRSPSATSSADRPDEVLAVPETAVVDT